MIDTARGERTTPWLIADSTTAVPVILHWWAPTVPGAPSGGLVLQVGDSSASLFDLDNGGVVVEEHAIGVWDVRMEGKPGFGNASVSSEQQVTFDDVLVVY